MSDRCTCGDYACPSCGTAQGTYIPRYEPDPEDLNERDEQREIDSE